MIDRFENVFADSSRRIEVEKEEGGLSAAESEIIALFADTALVLGMPKSYGQIYGYLFAQIEPKTMEQIVKNLGISLGSASQGLKALRHLGAVRSDYLPGTRRDAFIAELELKKLIGGFVREQFMPHMQSGKVRLRNLEQNIPLVKEKGHRATLQDRLKKLKKWQRRANGLVPLLEMALAR